METNPLFMGWKGCYVKMVDDINDTETVVKEAGRHYIIEWCLNHLSKSSTLL